MIGGFVYNAVDSALQNAPFMHTETFESRDGVSSSPTRVTLVLLISILIIFLITLFVGKYLWNNVLTEMVTCVKPVKSVWYIFGLYLLVSLIHPCNC